MKKTFVLLLSLMLLGISCKSNKEVTRYDYESNIVEVGTQGTAVIKAWGEGKNIEAAKVDAKRNAVYSILFKGFPSADGINSTDRRPMVTNPNAEQQYKEFFKKFFADNGKFLQYVRFADDQARVGLGDVVSTSKGKKVGVVVVVDKQALRREMESQGIIQKFGIN